MVYQEASISSDVNIGRLDSEMAVQEREGRTRAQRSSLLRAIELARIRCMSPSELVNGLERIGKADPDRRRRIVDQLLSTQFSSRAKEQLQETLMRLDERTETVSRGERMKLDRVISRLIRLLDPADARAMAYGDLAHGRSLRRERAWQSFRMLGVGVDFGQQMLDLFRRTREQRCLQIIARDPIAVSATDPLFLLENLHDRYWRGRVFLAWVESDEERALQHKCDYPWALIYSVGKSKSEDLLETAAGVAQARENDLELQSIYAWMLGQLGDIGRIAELERRFPTSRKAETAHD